MTEKDYISRDAVLALTDDYELTLPDDEIFFEYIDPKKVAAIPAADVREVVLCKDCLHEDCAMYHGPNWFCADGEKREGS